MGRVIVALSKNAGLLRAHRVHRIGMVFAGISVASLLAPKHRRFNRHISAFNVAGLRPQGSYRVCLFRTSSQNSGG